MNVANFLYFITIHISIYENVITLLTTPSKGKQNITGETTNDTFVDLIKQDLRRDNDDYLESAATTQVIGHNKEDIKNDTIKDIYAKPERRKINNITIEDKNESDSESYNNELNSEVVQLDDTHMATNLMHESTTAKRLVTTTKDNTRSTRDKNIKRENIQSTSFKVLEQLKISNKTKETIKKFLNVNKKAFKKFVKYKQKNKTSQIQDAMIRARSSSSSESESSSKEKIPWSQTEPPVRFAAGAAPHPDQLDMAPARGAHVHFKRIAGRLCQRNVLMPEGPKYNSKGRAYLPAHEPAHGRDYPRTRAPRLVLPRCCNCCKKSVLGCE